MKTLTTYAIIASAVFLLSSCCRKPIYNSEHRDSVRTEYITEYRDRLLRDTTYVRDSVMIRQRGDTVLVYRDKYVYVDRYVKDTLRVSDTVFQYINREVEKIVEKKHIPRFFWYCFAVAVAAVGYLALRLTGKIPKR